MRIRSISILAALVLSSAIAGLAQTTNSQPATLASKPKRVPPPMLPYTAEFNSTRVQTLANGTTITSESTFVEARDGQNRIYRANTQPRFPTGPEITIFRISDPVAGTETRWDSHSKKVTVIELPPQEQRHGCWRTESGRSSFSYPLTPEQRAVEKATELDQAVVRQPTRHPKQENLGTDVIQGLTVHGNRMTETIPAGEIGNDQPIVRISETWISNDFRLSARSIDDDPQNGKTTRELTKFEPGEPDPGLFHLPQGYEVVTEPLHQVPCHD